LPARQADYASAIKAADRKIISSRVAVSLKEDNRPQLLVVCGPTAVGKTAFALNLAENFDGEVVSADSRQVYRLMDIGTAKPTRDEMDRVKHHLVNVAWPDEEFNAARFVLLAEQCISEICQRQKRPLLVGGTGLYIRALTEGLLQAPGADQELRRQLHDKAEEQGSAVLHEELTKVDPESAKRLHPNDLIRIVRALEVYEQSGQTLSSLQDEHGFSHQPYRMLKIGLNLDREELFRRIDLRAEAMFEQGLLDEAEALLQAGYDRNLKTLKTIGYRQAFALLNREMTRDEALEDLKRSTRRYAKQQLTWFRKDKSIIWLESSDDFDTIQRLIENFYVI
jgi:tRNA dimethylallyltransferase